MTCQACADAYTTNYPTYWCVAATSGQSTSGWVSCTTSANNCANGATTYWGMTDFSACVPYTNNVAGDNWVVTTVSQVSRQYTVSAASNKWWVITNQ